MVLKAFLYIDTHFMYLFVVAVSLFYIIKVGMSDVCILFFYFKHCNNLVQTIILLNYFILSVHVHAYHVHRICIIMCTYSLGYQCSIQHAIHADYCIII